MVNPKIMDIGPDETEIAISDIPPLQKEGDVTFDPPAGNPDETVKLDADMIDVGGVEIASELLTPDKGD